MHAPDVALTTSECGVSSFEWIEASPPGDSVAFEDRYATRRPQRRTPGR